MNTNGVDVHLTRGLRDPDAFHERLRADPVFAERLAYCVETGEVPSIFAGRTWPNPLDPTEPKWLEEDRSDVLSYRIWKRGVCPQCGVHERDWGSDAEQPYIAKARLCHGCVEVLDAQEEYRDHEHPGALRLALVTFDPDEAAGA